MKARRRKTIRIFLELNEKEATILKQMVQNPREEHDREDREFMKELFTTLKGQLEK